VIAACTIEKCCQQQPDPDNPDDTEDRFVQVGTTFGGAAVLRGNLTPECATAVRAVQEAPGNKAAPRTTAPRRSASTMRSSSPVPGSPAPAVRWMFSASKRVLELDCPPRPLRLRRDREGVRCLRRRLFLDMPQEMSQ
jgi:hypothetical protein